MFHSAVIRLTGWYLLILMSISILFSVTIYNAATGEVRDRLSDFQQNIEQPGYSPNSPPNDASNPRLFSALRQNQRTMAEHNLQITLFYVNLLILLGGGMLSYLLARRTLKQIEQAHLAQSQFASDASHELRTPLAAMRTELEVALRDPKLSKADMKEILASNLEEVDKLTTMSKTLLQLSRLDHANLDIQDINLGTVTSEIIQRYDKNAERIVLSQPNKPLIIRGNPSSIEELITILVDNALKYSPKKSTITVALGMQGKYATFSIANGGDGIASDKLPHVFDRFYRADESRTAGGTGLGLALAKEIIAIHNGELSVSSAPGGDTTFQFSLPFGKSTKA